MIDYKTLYVKLERHVDKAMSLMHQGDVKNALMVLMSCQRARDMIDRAEQTGEALDINKLPLR